MARTGRFGHASSKAPDLTATIVALLEQYESARDRNILNAWLNGGKFEGAKVTDERIKQWYKMRRSQFDKDDPEYDYWDQQYEQIDYQIGESKMLLTFEQGKIKEGAAAAWYTQNANRFPKNSEAWREAMRNAARFKKAAQEKARAAGSVSQSEKYQSEIDRIYNTKVKPAEQAIRIWEQALRSEGHRYVDGFMGMQGDSMKADETMRAFLRTRKGNDLAKRWQNLTGEKFSYKSFRQMVRAARNGYLDMAGVAKKYGYQSYVPGFEEQERKLGEYNVQLNTFTSDIYDQYMAAAEEFYGNYDSWDEETRLRKTAEFAKQVQKWERQSRQRGDHNLAGAFKGEADVLTGKEGAANVTPVYYNNQAGVAADPLNLDPTFVAQDGVETGQLDLSNLTPLEGIAQQNAYYEEVQKPGLEDGTWIKVLDNETGELSIRQVTDIQREAGTGGSFSEMGYAVNYIKNPDGTRSPVLIQRRDVVFDAGFPIAGSSTGEYVIPNMQMYTNLNGEVRYYMPDPDGGYRETSVNPIIAASEWEDDDPATPPGHFRMGRQIMPVVIVDKTTGRHTLHSGFTTYLTAQFNAANPTTIPGEGATPEATSAYEQALQQFIMGNINNLYPQGEGIGGTTVFQTALDADQKRVWEGQVRNPENKSAEEAGIPYPEFLDEMKRRHDEAAVESGQPTYDEMSEAEQKTWRERVSDGYRGDQTAMSDETAQWVNDYQTKHERPEGVTPEATFTQGEWNPERWGRVAPYVKESLVEAGLWDDEKNAPLADASEQEVRQVLMNVEGIDKSERDFWRDTDFTEGSPEIGGGYRTGSGYVEPDGETYNVVESAQPRIDATITMTIEIPTVYNDTGTTYDGSGVLGQYQSQQGREELAGMSSQERIDLVNIIVGDANKDNALYKAEIANEVEALAAAGAMGLDDFQYIAQSGAMSDDPKLRRLLDKHNEFTRSDTTSDYFEDGLIGKALAQGFTDADIRSAGFGDLLDEYKQEQVVREYDRVSGPAVYAGATGTGYAWDQSVPATAASAQPSTGEQKPTTVAGAVDNIVSQSWQAANNVPYGSTSTSNLRDANIRPNTGLKSGMGVKPVKTVKPVPTEVVQPQTTIPTGGSSRGIIGGGAPTYQTTIGAGAVPGATIGGSESNTGLTYSGAMAQKR